MRDEADQARFVVEEVLERAVLAMNPVSVARRVALTVPKFTLALAQLAESNVVATLPGHLVVRGRINANAAEGIRSLPLNRPRRLARHVIHNAVDALHLIDDPRRGAAEEIHVERIEIRGHAVA